MHRSGLPAVDLYRQVLLQADRNPERIRLGFHCVYNRVQLLRRPEVAVDPGSGPENDGASGLRNLLHQEGPRLLDGSAGSQRTWAQKQAAPKVADRRSDDVVQHPERPAANDHGQFTGNHRQHAAHAEKVSFVLTVATPTTPRCLTTITSSTCRRRPSRGRKYLDSTRSGKTRRRAKTSSLTCSTRSGKISPSRDPPRALSSRARRRKSGRRCSRQRTRRKTKGSWSSRRSCPSSSPTLGSSETCAHDIKFVNCSLDVKAAD